LFAPLQLSRFAAFAFVAWVLNSSAAHAAKSALVVTFDQRQIAATLWYPDTLDVIRGVLVVTGGQGQNDQSGDTRGMADSAFYQRFAESIGFAILGNQFSGSYTDAGSGPGQALLDTLTVFASKTNHPELANAPLLLEGFSNGGYFSFTFAKWKPGRVIAFALNKSGFTKAELDPAFAGVPGVLFWGEEEGTKGMPTVIHSLVMQGRQQHALWAELKEWGRGHEEGEVERVFIPFFADMVAARYPNGKTPRTGEVQLIALDETTGWLGDHADASINMSLPTISTFAAYSGDKAGASWLPNEGIANLWRGFVTKTPLKLDSPATNAQLNAAQAMQLSASGVVSGETVNFLDGARTLAVDVAASGGVARASWTPEWGGGRGIVAVAKSGGASTRTSRPAAIALYGKAPPPGPPQPEPSAAPPAGAGPGGAQSGEQTGPNSTPNEPSEPRPAARDSGTSDAMTPDASEVEPDASPAADGGELIAADGGESSPADGGEPHAPRKHHKPAAGCTATLELEHPAPGLTGITLLGIWLALSARRRAKRQRFAAARSASASRERRRRAQNGPCHQQPLGESAAG
jgi:hypothetical protein